PPSTSDSYSLSLHDALPIWPIIEFSCRGDDSLACSCGYVLGRRSVVQDCRNRARRKTYVGRYRLECDRSPIFFCRFLDLSHVSVDRKSTRLNSSHDQISYAV